MVYLYNGGDKFDKILQRIAITWTHLKAWILIVPLLSLFFHFSYIVPVFLLSIILNIPKFLETRFVYLPTNMDMNSTIENVTSSSDLVVMNSSEYQEEFLLSRDINSTDVVSYGDGDDDEEDEYEYEISLGVSELRDNPDYIRIYINWTRFLATGLVPMVALVYFNSRIFRGIQAGWPNCGGPLYIYKYTYTHTHTHIYMSNSAPKNTPFF